MESLQPYGPAIALAGLAVGIVALVGWLMLQARVQKFARPYEELAQAAAAEGVPAALQAQLLGVEKNAARIEATLAYTQKLHAQLDTALQGIGFLKYDAFEDIRGTQSYSLCVLDAKQNGVILTSIAGRNDYRGYAKPVVAGNCELALSDEEKQVLGKAKDTLATGPHAVAATAAPEPVGAGAA
jgi:hypothetical protein